MTSTKESRDFILEQLSEALNITYWPMMGEFLLYSNNVLFGGIKCVIPMSCRHETIEEDIPPMLNRGASNQSSIKMNAQAVNMAI